MAHVRRAGDGLEIEIVVHGDPAGDEARNLRGWLLDESDLRGRVKVRERPVEPGTLAGGILEAVVVAVGGGAAVIALVRTLGNVLVTWLKTRRGQVDITVTGPDGTKVVLATKDVRGLGADGVREVLDDLTQKLMPQPKQAGSTDGRSSSAAAADSASATGATGVPGAAESVGTAGASGPAGTTGRGRARAGRRADPAS